MLRPQPEHHVGEDQDAEIDEVARLGQPARAEIGESGKVRATPRNSGQAEAADVLEGAG
jgi:hypothetical protein